MKKFVKSEWFSFIGIIYGFGSGLVAAGTDHWIKVPILLIMFGWFVAWLVAKANGWFKHPDV